MENSSSAISGQLSAGKGGQKIAADVIWNMYMGFEYFNFSLTTIADG